MNWLKKLMFKYERMNSRFTLECDTRVVLKDYGYGAKYYPEFKLNGEWLSFIDGFGGPSWHLMYSPASFNYIQQAEDYCERMRLKLAPKIEVISTQAGKKCTN